jgi:hypothetical protein
MARERTAGVRTSLGLSAKLARGLSAFGSAQASIVASGAFCDASPGWGAAIRCAAGRAWLATRLVCARCLLLARLA